MGRAGGDGLKGYYRAKIEELELQVKDKTHNLRRLEAQRNELNSHGAQPEALATEPAHSHRAIVTESLATRSPHAEGGAAAASRAGLLCGRGYQGKGDGGLGVGTQPTPNVFGRRIEGAADGT